MGRSISFVTGSMGRGGAERVISILSAFYAKKGWNVDIAMLLHSNVEYPLETSVSVTDLSYSGGIKKGLVQTLASIRKYVKNRRPDVIVCFMAQNCLLTGIALTGIKCPIIMSERIDPAEVNRSWLYRFLLTHYYTASKKVIFQTERAKEYFDSMVQQNACIIGNPIQVQTMCMHPSKHRIVSAGRMTEQKNQKMLVSAFSRIHNAFPDYTLTIYGEGPLRGELQAQIEDLKLEDAVFLPGNVLDLHEQIKDAAIFVLPSNYEGLSNALLEAMMMGLPVIATNCAGCDEVIENGKNGLLIDVGDEEALAASLEDMICDEAFRNALARNGQDSVQRFRVENIIQEWDRIISDCVSG